jgi:hypothetical protein
MATLSLGLTSGVVTGSRNYTLSDADVARWISALRIIHKMPTETDAQVLAHWADDVVVKAKANVKMVERKAAVNAAAAGITDIDVS